jgi:APA family basic amino acid/polyamine antiporter
MRKLSFWQASAIGLGNIIGAGIFVLAGSAIKESGPAALVAFLITASLATTVGLNSAELASKISNVQGGVYSFARYAFGERIGFIVGWFRMISYAISGSAVALGFSGYFVSIGFPSDYSLHLSVLLIIVLSYIEIRGIRVAAKAEEALVFVNLLGLAVFIGFILSISRISSGDFNPFFPYGIDGLLRAANIGFFAYSGFNTIATLTPDVENGGSVVPKAIIFSIVVSTSIYFLILFSMLIAMNWSEYAGVANPLSLALSKLRAPFPIRLVVALSALTATLTVTLSLIIAGSRTTKQMGRDGLLPSIFNRNESIPTIIIAIIMILFLALGDVKTIALIANFGVIFSYMLSGPEVITLRRRNVDGFRSPGYPFTQLFSVFLSLILMANLGLLSIEIGLTTLIIGLIENC